MSSKVNVRVTSVDHTTVQSSAGKDLNYVVIKGFDETNNRGFKKQFFATKQDGSPTVNATKADSLNKGDWVEITMDDSKWQNVETLRVINEPSGASAPSTGSASSQSGGNSRGGGGSKQFRTVPQLNREQALKFSIAALGVNPKATKAHVDKLLKLAVKFEDYLVNGFGTAEPINPVTKPTEPADTPEPADESGDTYDPETDIPF